MSFVQHLKGGLADRKQPKDFNSKSLKKGQRVEREHTDKPDLAKEIAMDHLAEDPKYYEKLEAMEKKSFCLAFAKTAKVLTAKGRKHIKEENFALPGRRYPLHDRSHALSALQRVSQYGTAQEKRAVRKAVLNKYPGIQQSN